MRRSPQDRSLPLIYMQVFALVIIAALTAAAIIDKNTQLALGIVAFAGAVVGVGGFIERANREVRKVLEPDEKQESDS